jgi:hypothetical protein
MLFAWESEPRSALGRWSKRLCSALVFGSLFLLPLFAYLAAEPTPYRDPGGKFSITVPEGWVIDDSGHMGPGLVAKGPAGPAGVEPLIHLTHQPAGIVTHEVRWQTLLGQMRFDYERMKFLAVKEQPDADPVFGQAVYVYQRGSLSYQAVTRLVLAKGEFFELTAAAPESEFFDLYPGLLASFDSLRAGGN